VAKMIPRRLHKRLVAVSKALLEDRHVPQQYLHLASPSHASIVKSRVCMCRLIWAA
jgi:hypothetical protein